MMTIVKYNVTIKLTGRACFALIPDALEGVNWYSLQTACQDTERSVTVSVPDPLNELETIGTVQVDRG